MSCTTNIIFRWFWTWQENFISNFRGVIVKTNDTTVHDLEEQLAIRLGRQSDLDKWQRVLESPPGSVRQFPRWLIDHSSSTLQGPNASLGGCPEAVINPALRFPRYPNLKWVTPTGGWGHERDKSGPASIPGPNLSGLRKKLI